MSNELQTIDNFKDILKNKVKKSFINLIPEETLDKFVEEIVIDFEKKELRNLILEELRIYTKKEVQLLIKELSQTTWNGKNNEFMPKIKNILIEAAPEMFTAIMSHTIQHALMNAKPY